MKRAREREKERRYIVKSYVPGQAPSLMTILSREREKRGRERQRKRKREKQTNRKREREKNRET